MMAPDRVRIEEDTPDLVLFTIPPLFASILDNVISNALKYSDTASVVEITIQKIDCGVTISVKDKGVGIPPECLSHISEPFYRATNAHRHKGTGLGLYAARQAIHALGGDLRMESQVGVGTTVRLWFPCEQANPARPVQALATS